MGPPEHRGHGCPSMVDDTEPEQNIILMSPGHTLELVPKPDSQRPLSQPLSQPLSELDRFSIKVSIKAAIKALGWTLWDRLYTIPGPSPRPSPIRWERVPEGRVRVGG